MKGSMVSTSAAAVVAAERAERDLGGSIVVLACFCYDAEEQINSVNCTNLCEVSREAKGYHFVHYR